MSDNRVHTGPIPGGKSGAARHLDAGSFWQAICTMQADVRKLHTVSADVQAQNREVLKGQQEQTRALKAVAAKLDRLIEHIASMAKHVAANTQTAAEAIDRMDENAEVVMEAAMRASYQGVVPGDAAKLAEDHVAAIRRRKAQEREERESCRQAPELTRIESKSA